MAKYNFEFKKKIVLEHLSLGVGSKALAKKYNVKSARQIRQRLLLKIDFLMSKKFLIHLLKI